MVDTLKAISGNLNIVTDAMTDRTITFTYKTNGLPVDLTNYTAEFTLRTRQTNTETIFQLTVGSGIVLGGVNGTIDCTFTDTQLDLKDSNNVYSLVIIDPSGNITPISVGTFSTVARA